MIMSRMDPCHWLPGQDADPEDENETKMLTQMKRSRRSHHRSASASCDLDRTATMDPDRTARLVCLGSPHRNAVSADYKVPRSTDSGHS